MIVGYKRDSMIVQAVGCVAVAIGCAWAFTQVGNLQWKITFGGLAIILPIVAMALGIRATGDLVALDFDERGVSVCTLWRKTRLDWRNVKSIHRETLEQTSGFVKQTVAWYMVVTAHQGDGFERQYKLNEKLLDMPQTAIPALVGQMELAWAGSMPRGANVPSPVVADRTSEQPAGDRDDAFDPDGIIARYMAQKNGVVPEPPASARPVFGRKVA